jgi:hypothetical protein
VIVFVDAGAGGGEELHAASVKATTVKAKHPVNLPIEWKCAAGRPPLSREPVHSEPRDPSPHGTGNPAVVPPTGHHPSGTDGDRQQTPQPPHATPLCATTSTNDPVSHPDWGGFGTKIRGYARRARILIVLRNLDKCVAFFRRTPNDQRIIQRARSEPFLAPILFSGVCGGVRSIQQKLPVATNLGDVGAIQTIGYQRTSVPTECEQIP